jgi:phosphate transport system substrate-binding protein
MSQGKGKETGALVLSLLVTVGLIAGGLWFLTKQMFPGVSLPGSSTGQTGQAPQNGSPEINAEMGTAQINMSQPNPQVLAMDGSVSLVTLVKSLQVVYSQINPAIPSTYGVPDGRPNGTNQGLQNLIKGDVMIAASSRPLKGDEVQAGLVAVPIARDAIAIVVGVNNPFQGSLTLDQLKQIYQGRITNWSQVGGRDAPIKVINRATSSGTGSFFKELVLLGGNFAPDGPNFVTLPRDETTPMLQALGNNGIGYATVSQVANQKTVRIVAVDNVQPADAAAIASGQYPLSRVLYLVARRETSPAVKEFMDLVLAPQGQQIVQRVGLFPLK